MVHSINAMTQKTVKLLYKYLEKHSLPAIVNSIECIVALCRNKRSGPVDCQLYLQNYDPWIYKLKNADLSEVDE